MQKSPNRKVRSKSYTLFNHEFKPIEDPKINQAVKKFFDLNNSYQMQSQVIQFLKDQSIKKFPRKRNGKIDGFVIMAQLRHLQNLASLNNAEQEQYQRQKSKNFLSTKRSPRKVNNWRKVENSLNQPYLKIYEQYQKQKWLVTHQQDDFEVETETQQSIYDNQSLDGLNFSKQLKPYKKIISYAQQKKKMKNKINNSSLISQKKIKYLEQLRSAPQNKLIYKDYIQISKKLGAYKDQQKKKKQGGLLTEQIVHKQINRIFKKSDEDHMYQQIKDQQRFQRLIVKQKQLLNKSINQNDKNQIQNKNFKIVKQKLESIIVEIAKGSNKLGQSKRKFSNSLDLTRKLKSQN